MQPVGAQHVLMAVLPYWHTVGGHYTFERVPFDPYIEELRRWQKLLDQPENVEPDGYGHQWGRVQLAEVRKYAAERPELVPSA